MHLEPRGTVSLVDGLPATWKTRTTRPPAVRNDLVDRQNIKNTAQHEPIVRLDKN